MTLVRNPIRFEPECLKSLSGGCAPYWWRADVAANTQWLNATFQACGWLSALHEIDVRMSRDPLFGYGLTLLTSREQYNPAVSEPSRRPMNRSANDFEKGARKSRTTADTIAPTAIDASRWDPETKSTASRSEKPGSSYLPELITRFEPRASSWLLHRHAEVPESSVGDAFRPNVKRLLEKSAEGANTSPKLPRDPTPVRLLERAVRSAETAFFTRGRLAGEFYSARTNNQVEGSTLAFAENWSRPVDGVRASLALLAVLANQGAAVAPSSPNEQKKATVAENTVDSPHGRSQSLPSIEPQTNSFLAHRRFAEIEWPAEQRTKQSLQDAEDESTEGLLDDTNGLLPRRSPRHAVERNEQLTVESRIAAPTLTSSLVALRPRAAPRNADLPVAATINQREARAEAASSEADELAHLAAKVEKLLNQEARRHGIDV